MEDYLLLVKVNELDFNRIMELRSKITKRRFDKEFMKWVNKILDEIKVKDGGVYIVK